MEVADRQGDDLGRSDPGQAQVQDELITHADVPVSLAASEQPPESLLVGEPAGRVLGLDLAVEPRHTPQRVVPVADGLDDRRSGVALPDAPTQEGGRQRQAVADGVVGGRTPGARAPPEHVGRVAVGEILDEITSVVSRLSPPRSVLHVLYLDTDLPKVDQR